MLHGDREHFGFRDGFSQPSLAGIAEDRRSRRGEGVQRRRLRLTGDEWRSVRLGEFVLGRKDEDGVVPGGSDPLLVNGHVVRGTGALLRGIRTDFGHRRRAR